MLDEIEDDTNLPRLTVSAETYNAILLADGAVVMAAHGEIPGTIQPENSKLPDFFAVRRCRLTAGRPRLAPEQWWQENSALLMSMVGG